MKAHFLNRQNLFFILTICICTLLSFSQKGSATSPSIFIYFDHQSAELSQEAKDYLDEEADRILEKPNFWVKVNGGADDNYSEFQNNDLSKRRAYAVVNYLLENYPSTPGSVGFSLNRMTVAGYGSKRNRVDTYQWVSDPINRFVEVWSSCCIEDGEL